MNFSIDLISKGLPKIAMRSTTSQPVDTFLSEVLFGGPSIGGNEKQDGVVLEYRKYVPHIAEEALRGQDPARMNYQSKFNDSYIIPNYYHVTDEVSIEDADARVFGEPLEGNEATIDRVVRRFADKRDAIHDSFLMAKEDMAADAIFNAQIVNKSGTQPLPMTSGLLSQTGSTMYTDFLGTIKGGFNNTRKKNRGFRPNALILNPTYAILLIEALNTAGLLNKMGYDLAVAKFAPVADKGIQVCGSVNTPAGQLAILAYYGNDGTYDYIPDQKAILCNADKGGIGSFAYGRVQAFEEGRGPHYVVEEERYRPFIEGQGDMAHYAIEVQSAPFPVITNLDGYCVFTSIPSSLS